MLSFIFTLPDAAFNFVGDLSTEARLLFTYAPPGTSGWSHQAFGRVLYRWGWGDQSPEWVDIYFVLPSSNGYGPEVLVIAVHTSAWGYVNPQYWKTMILRFVPMGVERFPCG